jgi:transcriptional regulator with XRE-family HTH domain
MPRTIPSLLPKLSRLLAQVGANLKLARLRRSYSAEIVAERSGITRRTLQRVEQGDPAVALGIYARVLQALGLVEDLAALARDDALGRRLQDLDLPIRKRAPRQSNTDEKAGQKR